MQRIYGRTYQIPEGTDLSNIVAQGVARIYLSQDRFRLADPVFVDALFEHCSGKEGIIINDLSNAMDLGKALVSQDQYSKGFLTERALSWIVQQHKVPYPSTACVAGTTQELFGSRCQKESEASLLIKIAMGEEDKIVFPSTSAGPDIWYLGRIKNDSFVVAIQSKCLKTALNHADFKSALDSLNPTKMFSANNTNSNDKLIGQMSLSNFLQCLIFAVSFLLQAFLEKYIIWLMNIRIKLPLSSE